MTLPQRQRHMIATNSESSSKLIRNPLSRPSVILDIRLVLSTLQPLLKTAPTRPCYRLIGGTLVQRTVSDVYPTLETNYTGIKEVLETLVKTYRGKEDEFGGFQKEYGIQVCKCLRGAMGPAADR